MCVSYSVEITILIHNDLFSLFLSRPSSGNLLSLTIFRSYERNPEGYVWSSVREDEQVARVSPCGLQMLAATVRHSGAISSSDMIQQSFKCPLRKI